MAYKPITMVRRCNENQGEEGFLKDRFDYGSQNVANDVFVRFGKEDDIEEIASVTASAFCAQDELLIYLQKLANRRWWPMVMMISRIFERITAKDVSMQLKKRICNDRNDAHIVLVAEHVESGRLIGCVEVGLVQIDSVANGRPGEAVRQWEQSIVAAKKVKPETRQTSSQQSDFDENDKATRNGNDQRGEVLAKSEVGSDGVAYMGNLAVEPEFRRLGVASALVTEACRRANVLWRRCIWLHVEADNVAAMSLYRKLGFGCEARDPEWSSQIGRRQKLLLRSQGGVRDWSSARLRPFKMNVWEYLRWCIYDLKRQGDRNVS